MWRNSISHTELLALRLSKLGLLSIDLETMTVWQWRDRQSDFVEKKIHRHPKSSRRKVKFGNRYVYLNRLVWICTYGELPQGVVDHVDGDSTNDRVENLRVHSRAESDRQGGHRRVRQSADEVEWYFDHIAFWGVEPPCDTPRV